MAIRAEAQVVQGRVGIQSAFPTMPGLEGVGVLCAGGGDPWRPKVESWSFCAGCPCYFRPVSLCFVVGIDTREPTGFERLVLGWVP